MSTTRASGRTRLLAAIAAAAATLAVSGCGISNPYTATSTTSPSTSSSSSSPANPGELPAPPPPTAASQAPADVKATPQAALRQFAQLYINWTYRTLVADQRTLAAISVAPARLSEQQAAASSAADSTITRGQIVNTGRLVSLSPSLTVPGQWVLVTRESTGGNPAYDGLQAAYHVTLATLAHVPGGYAISQWQPQN